MILEDIIRLAVVSNSHRDDQVNEIIRRVNSDLGLEISRQRALSLYYALLYRATEDNLQRLMRGEPMLTEELSGGDIVI